MAERMERGSSAPSVIVVIRARADAVLLVPGVDVQLGDDEGVVEPVVVAPGAQIGLDDGGPPVGAVVGHAVDEADQVALDGGAEGAGAGEGHVAQHDLPAYGHLVGTEPERHRLHRQRLVDVAGRSRGPITMSSGWERP
ncbi:hypothetical protein GCM10023238_04480 [Streptomyces heliomycini]